MNLPVSGSGTRGLPPSQQVDPGPPPPDPDDGVLGDASVAPVTSRRPVTELLFPLFIKLCKNKKKKKKPQSNTNQSRP